MRSGEERGSCDVVMRGLNNEHKGDQCRNLALGGAKSVAWSKAERGKQGKPGRDDNYIWDICYGRSRRGLRRPSLVDLMEPVVWMERLDEL